MPAPTESLSANSTAALIRKMAAEHRVSYMPTRSDLLADEITRLSGDTIKLDEIEYLLVALQRAGHISRDQLTQLQTSYLREIKS